MTKSARKLLVAGLAAAGLSASAAPAYAAPETGPAFCQFVPRICQVLCIGGSNTRCR